MNYQWLKRILFTQVVIYILVLSWISYRVFDHREDNAYLNQRDESKISHLINDHMAVDLFAEKEKLSHRVLVYALEEQKNYDQDVEERLIIENQIQLLHQKILSLRDQEVLSLRSLIQQRKLRWLNLVEAQFYKLSVVFVCALLLLFLNVYFLLRAWQKPIEKMNLAMREFRKENFSYSVEVDNESDKLSQLMRDLNILARKLELLQSRNEEHLEQLEFDAKQLQESVHSKTKFVRYLGHELRSPLAVIQSFAEMMLEGYHGDVTVKQEESLQRIMNNSQNLLDLVNDLVEQAKAEAGTLALETEECDLIQFTEGLLDTLKIQVEKAQLKFVYSKNVDSLQVNINQIRMRQVFTNLLSNAIKFSECGTSLELKIYQKSNLAYIEFIDEGLGISAADKRKIFMEFHQGDSHHQSKGAGLGLYISRQIVRLHGGDIMVESEVGEGSNFRVQLPLR